MITILPMNCAKVGILFHSLIWIPIAADPSLFPKNLLLIRMELLCVLPVSAWFTGDTARNAMTVNGVVRLPVEKKKSARAKSLVPLLPTGAAFMLNLIGISVFIRRYQGVPKIIKRLTITAQVQNGWIIESSMITIYMIWRFMVKNGILFLLWLPVSTSIWMPV